MRLGESCRTSCCRECTEREGGREGGGLRERKEGRERAVKGTCSCRGLCLECRVSWVQVPPEAAYFSF